MRTALFTLAMLAAVGCGPREADTMTEPEPSSGDVEPTEPTPAEEPPPEPPPETVAEAPLGRWDHRREQDADGVQVWVRGQTLPPSRFRAAMELREGGGASYRVLHPADAHYMAEGAWALDGDTLTVTYTETHGEGREVTVRFGVVAHEGDELRLRPLVDP